jgi:hypothetical protein
MFSFGVAQAQEWTQTGLSYPNAWETVSHENWETVSLEGEAGFTYETTVENFSLWEFKIRLRGRAEIGNEADYVGNYFAQHIRFYVGDYPNGSYVQIEIIRTEKIAFGYIVWHVTGIWVSFGETKAMAHSDKYYVLGDMVYRIIVWRNTTDAVGVAVLRFDDWSSVKATQKSVYPEFANVGAEWFNNVTIIHEVYKGLGYGWCGGEIKYEQFILNQGIVIPDLEEKKTLAEQIADAIVTAFSTLATGFLSVIPEPFRTFLTRLFDYAWFMVDIIVALFSALAAIAPVLFSSGSLLYGLYLLGLTLTCLNEAEFQPLFDHFITMWNFITGLMSKVIAFLQWIWNQIKVW